MFKVFSTLLEQTLHPEEIYFLSELQEAAQRLLKR